MKKFLSVLLTVVMLLSIITLIGTSASAQSTLVRVPSTIPGTNIPYNYVENVTVKIPGTEVTFGVTGIAESVLIKQGSTGSVTKWDSDREEYITVTYTYDIPVYRFTFYETFGEATISQDGTWNFAEGNTLIGDVFEVTYNKGAVFGIPPMTEENEKHIRNKLYFDYSAIITSNNSCVIPADSSNETAVAEVEFRFINPYYYGFDDNFNESDYDFGNWDKTIDISELMVSDDTPTLYITKPSQTTINYKDGIVLCAEVENITDCAKIEWTADNDNFKLQRSEDGKTLTAISNKNGATIFTATLYDTDGNVLAEDTVELNSKAGFFQKLIGFFKGLFGLAKILDK